jgi:hypothetical protein
MTNVTPDPKKPTPPSKPAVRKPAAKKPARTRQAAASGQTPKKASSAAPAPAAKKPAAKKSTSKAAPAKKKAPARKPATKKKPATRKKPAPKGPDRPTPTLAAATSVSPPPPKPLPPTPDKLGPRGRKMWRAVVEKYELRPDETFVLDSACRGADRVHDLRNELDGMDVMMLGSTAQLVVNPLYSAISAHEAHVAALLARLKLKDVADSGGVKDEPRSTAARDKANARWRTPHGHSA